MAGMVLNTGVAYSPYGVKVGPTQRTPARRAADLANDRTKQNIGIDRESMDLTKGQDERRYGFAQKHDGRVDQMMQMLMQDGPAGASSSTTTESVNRLPGAPAGPSPDGAADAGYARLKEREGLRLRGAINTTKGALGRRGLTGSSFESPAIAALVGESSGNLADFDAASMADAVGRSRQLEDRDFAAGERRRETTDSRKDARMQALMALIGNGPAY